jgi:flagellar hook assembly protein FlgD
LTTLARAVFAALVIATFGAFFAAQRLKHAPTVIQSFKANRVFSPNSDGRFDRLNVSFLLKEADDVTVDIVDHNGDEVRTIADDRPLEAYRKIPTLKWDGRDEAGRRVPDGLYRARITLRRQGRSIVVPRAFRLDTEPPSPAVFAMGPEKGPGPELLPRPGGGPVTAHVRAPGRRVEVLLFKTAPRKPRLVLSEQLAEGVTKWQWDGRRVGRAVSPGAYLVVVRCRDKAGNVGSSVPLSRRSGLPVTGYGTTLEGRAGITVRYLGVAPPVDPTPAGERGEFFVDARQQRYTWSMRRVGGPPRPVRRGSGTRARLRIHAPRGESGVYLVTVRTRRHQVRVPFAVQSGTARSGTADAPRGVLVVLPVMTWQGRNLGDDDGDGLPNSLDRGDAVRLLRVLGGDGLPAGFAGGEAPVLGFLDRNRRRYDVTTDVALAAGRGPKLAGHKGVLLPGDARWLPAALGRRLRRFVRAGGVVASLGTDSLRRQVRLTPRGRAIDPTAPAPTDLFGERLRAVVRKPADLTILEDDIQLFAGTGGLFPGITAYEETADVGNQATLAAGAITPVTPAEPEGRLVIVAARFGRGLVIRPGLPDFAQRLTPSREMATLMERTWTLLSR